MKRVIEELLTIDGKKVKRVTTCDERFYEFEGIFVPSVTWICDFYPKGVAFYKWLASHGWDEAESLKQAAGDKGSKVHSAIVDLIGGKTVKMEHCYYNETLDKQEELTLEEYEAILSFVAWWKETKPVLIAQDYVIWNEKEGYAGTVDLLCKIENKTVLLDFKTSQYIWPSHELQLAAYRHASTDKIDETGILQLGYRMNKKKYKYTVIDDKYDLFLAAKLIWAEENEKIQPKQKDYPVEVSLNA
jgi:hypothetical protein